MFAWIAVVIGVILLDQVSKYLTVLYLKPMDSVVVIKDILRLNYQENPGMAFSMFDEPDERWIFMSVSTVALSLLAIYLFAPRPAWLSRLINHKLPGRPKSVLMWIGLSFILGGGIGNMIDRFALGYVVDMIDFYCVEFAVFNVADSFVCIGAGFMILALLLDMIKDAKAERAAAETAVVVAAEDAEGVVDAAVTDEDSENE